MIITMNRGVSVTGLTKSFGRTKALRGIDLRIEPGTVLGLLGPNGAGKTTAVRILATLLAPDGGQATVAGHDVRTHPGRVRQSIGLTGQDTAVDPYLTGRENLVMVGRLYGLHKAEAQRRAQRLLKRFGLTPAADRVTRTYSGGMNRRLDLAASLIGEPAVLFLDEPTTGLDPRGRREVWDIIRELIAEGRTILLTTQYLDEADELADQIAVIDEGRVVAEGTATELKQKIGGDRLQIRPTKPDQTQHVARVLRKVAGKQTVIDSEGFVLVPVENPRALAQAIRELDRAKIELADVGLRHPTLDDVFLKLTDRPAKRPSASRRKRSVR